MVLCILIFKFLHTTQDDKTFYTYNKDRTIILHKDIRVLLNDARL